MRERAEGFSCSKQKIGKVEAETRESGTRTRELLTYVDGRVRRHRRAPQGYENNIEVRGQKKLPTRTLPSGMHPCGKMEEMTGQAGGSMRR